MMLETRHRLVGSLAVVAIAAAIAAMVLALVATPETKKEAAGSISVAKPVTVDDIARAVADVPRPITRRGPGTVRATLETREVVAELEDGTTYEYWTFGGTVPGPMIRARVGDTVEVTIRNPEGSAHMHSVDLHAVLGPGGGMALTNSGPGQANGLRFRALRPGLYVYHCASEHIPSHIANGMYGLILIEPAGGLPEVDREFYVMQGELYTTAPRGQKGHHGFDLAGMADENPTFVVFNGRVGAVFENSAMRARAGESVRIFFGNGGPNLASNVHLIGGVFDRLYPEADILSPPHRNVQTTVVPPGGATIMEFATVVPGTFLLVDHSISRAVDKGAIGQLVVEGKQRPDVFAKL